MENTLYIIGNGFDLHHGLNTSYLNFRNYCVRNVPSLWKNLFEIYGDMINNDMWWSSFENKLGCVNYNNLALSNNGFALGEQKVQNLFKGMLPPIFGKWIKQIRKSPQMDTSLNIDTESLFFTFNYTLVLEEVYHIDENNVWHIHNSVKNPDNIIIGHDSDERVLFSTYSTNNTNYIVSPDFVDRVNSKIAQGSKNVKMRIENQKDRFYDLYSQIKHIVVMGFSFNKIDMPYIKAIIEVNKNAADVDWTIYFHSKGEDKIFIHKLLQIGVDRSQIKTPINW